ncbi:MAG: hypothetical protein LC808_15750 [Actinobacteria bacterium]|nr:hypothetical protein [Actinomycetota bacterium]
MPDDTMGEDEGGGGWCLLCRSSDDSVRTSCSDKDKAAPPFRVITTICFLVLSPDHYDRPIALADTKL